MITPDAIPKPNSFLEEFMQAKTFPTSKLMVLLSQLGYININRRGTHYAYKKDGKPVTISIAVGYKEQGRSEVVRVQKWLRDNGEIIDPQPELEIVKPKESEGEIPMLRDPKITQAQTNGRHTITSDDLRRIQKQEQPADMATKMDQMITLQRSMMDAIVATQNAIIEMQVKLEGMSGMPVVAPLPAEPAEQKPEKRKLTAEELKAVKRATLEKAHELKREKSLAKIREAIQQYPQFASNDGVIAGFAGLNTATVKKYREAGKI